MALAFDSPRVPNGNTLWRGRDMSKMNQCECCPYGYHIDLDFVRFCEKVSQRSDATLNRERRRERRRQRQSMEVLLGLTSQSFWNIEQQLPKVPQESPVVGKPRDPVETSNLVRDALHKAVQDFEDTLEQTHKPLVTHEIDGFAEVDESVATSLSSMSAESGPVTTQDVTGHDTLLQDFDVASVGSAASGHSHAALQNVRQQMALSLERMRDLEEQVKLIPVLQVQLAVAKEEKRKMQLCLREQQMKKGTNKTCSDIDDLSSANTNPSLSSTSIAQYSVTSFPHMSDIESVSAVVSRTGLKEFADEQGKGDIEAESLKKTEDWLLNRQLELLHAQKTSIDPRFEMVAHRSVSTGNLATCASSSHEILTHGKEVGGKQLQAEKPSQTPPDKSHHKLSHAVVDKPKVKRHTEKATDFGSNRQEIDKEEGGEILDRKSRSRERAAYSTEVPIKEPSQLKSKAIRNVGIQTLPAATSSVNQLDEGEQSPQTTLPRDSSISLKTMDSHPNRHSLEQHVFSPTLTPGTISSISTKAFESFITQYDWPPLHPRFIKKEEQVKAYSVILRTFLERHGITDQHIQPGTEKSPSKSKEPSAKAAIQEQGAGKTAKIRKISLQTLGEVRLPKEAQEIREDQSLEACQLPMQKTEAGEPYQQQSVDTPTNREVCRHCLQERMILKEGVDSSVQTSEESLTIHKDKKEYVETSIQTSECEQTCNSTPSRELTDSGVQTSDSWETTLGLSSLKDQATESQSQNNSTSVSDQTQYKSTTEESAEESKKKVLPFSYRTIDNSSQYDENDFSADDTIIEHETQIKRNGTDIHVSAMRAPVSLASLSQPPMERSQISKKKSEISIESQHHVETSAVRQAKQTGPFKHQQKIMQKNESAQTDRVTLKNELVQTDSQKVMQKNESVQTDKHKVVQKSESVQTDNKVIQKTVFVQTDRVASLPVLIKSSDIFKHEMNIKQSMSIQTDETYDVISKGRAIIVGHGVTEGFTSECVMCAASGQVKYDPRKRSTSQDRDSKIPRPAPPTDHSRRLLRQSTYTKIDVPEDVAPDTSSEKLWTSLGELNLKGEADVLPAPPLSEPPSEDRKAVRQQKYGAAAMSMANATSSAKFQASESKASPSATDIKITPRSRDDTGSSVPSSPRTWGQVSTEVEVNEDPSTISANPSEFYNASEYSKNSQTVATSSTNKRQDLSPENVPSVSARLAGVRNQSQAQTTAQPWMRYDHFPMMRQLSYELEDDPPLLPQPFDSSSFCDLVQLCAKQDAGKGASEKSPVLPLSSEKVPTAPAMGSKSKSIIQDKTDNTTSEVGTVSLKKAIGPRSERPSVKESSSFKLPSAVEAVPSTSRSRSNKSKEGETSTSQKEGAQTPSQVLDPTQQSGMWSTAPSDELSNSRDGSVGAGDGILQSREDILNLSERDRPKKVEPSTKMKAALKVVNDLIEKSQATSDIGNTAKAANTIIQREWFQVSGTPCADPHIVEDYLDHLEEMSSALLTYVVNMADKAGNTAMHYALSQGNFDVVSILLDSKVCNINLPNAAGYTAVMLVSLAQIRSDTHKCVLQRFLADADVNVRAQQHGQTALMLAVSHNRLDMVQLLIEGGADLNIQDDDGSTALMCAAEHGHAAIVQYLISQPDTDLNIKDVDGLTALDIALDAGHKDVGILLYAHKHFSRNNSPYSSLRGRRSKSATPTTRTASTPPPKTPNSPLPARHNARHSHE